MLRTRKSATTLPTEHLKALGDADASLNRLLALPLVADRACFCSTNIHIIYLGLRSLHELINLSIQRHLLTLIVILVKKDKKVVRLLASMVV